MIKISKREMEILYLVANGLSNNEIADTLVISPDTVKSHVSSLLRKFNVCSRVNLVALAIFEGYLVRDKIKFQQRQDII